MKKLFIIFAILCLAAPAMAADWNFYGSARMATWSVDIDPDINGVDSDRDTVWEQQGNSRIGATVKFNDEIGGAFEMNDSFGKRKLYGTYDFGAGQLLLGQTNAPHAWFLSNSVYDVDGDLLGRGEFYAGREEMIQLKFGGFKIAFIEPSTATSNGTSDIDTTLPKIEAGYEFKSDIFFVNAFGGYNSFTDETAGDDHDYDSYVFGVGGGVTFGPVFVKAGVHMGQNLGNYGAYNPSGLSDEATVVGGDLKDSDGLGYLAVLGFNASDRFIIEAGYGHEQAEIDGADDEDAVDQYYLNCTINITPGFFVVPEVGMIVEDPAGPGAEPDALYFGAKWQINF
ncbi:MAG: hypothetical protein CR984_07625 [Proteobacteria bacterium]|nr:MAG: hypothetical protein CR984_07625 [Pseudomonadota bacterium]